MTIETKEKKEEGTQKAFKENDHKKNAKWERPLLEDVSGKVMAQPYIRFT
ncbi:MAG: hypothetical protein HZA50_18625 [Planctomycetes bacterium]|nr:hypothetical protein [Planctomycetota bacterium]